MDTYPWLCFFVKVGVNNPGDADINCSCCHFRLVVGLSGGEGWSLEESGWGNGQGLGWVWLISKGGGYS